MNEEYRAAGNRSAVKMAALGRCHWGNMLAVEVMGIQRRVCITMGSLEEMQCLEAGHAGLETVLKEAIYLMPFFKQGNGHTCDAGQSNGMPIQYRCSDAFTMSGSQGATYTWGPSPFFYIPTAPSASGVSLAGEGKRPIVHTRPFHLLETIIGPNWNQFNVPIRRYLAAVERHINGSGEFLPRGPELTCGKPP